MEGFTKILNNISKLVNLDITYDILQNIYKDNIFEIKLKIISKDKKNIQNIKNNIIKNKLLFEYHLSLSEILIKEIKIKTNNYIFNLDNQYKKIINYNNTIIHVNDNIIIEFKIELEKIKYYTYLNILTDEIICIILSKCNDINKSIFNDIVKENKEINNDLIKYIIKDKIYNKYSDNILEQPYVKNFCDEIRNNLNYDYFSGKPDLEATVNKDIKLKLVYKGSHKTLLGKINIETLNFYKGTGKTILCNLNDEPWHGLDFIDNYGCIIDAKNHTQRYNKIKILKNRFNIK